MNKRTFLTLGIALAILIGLILVNGKRNVKLHTTEPFRYGQEDVTRFLKKHGIYLEHEVVSDVRCNAAGTELYVFSFETRSNTFPVIKITTNGPTEILAPGRDATLGPDGEFVSWAGKDGIHFHNGEVINLPEFGLFDIDPSGTYYIIGEKPNRTWLGRVESPSVKVVIADDLLADGVFASGNRIYVTGTSDTRDSLGRSNPVATCLILKDEGEAFPLIERLHFDGASGVVGVDPAGERLLLWNKAEISHTLYEYDLLSKRRVRIGQIKGFEFFLVADLLK